MGHEACERGQKEPRRVGVVVVWFWLCDRFGLMGLPFFLLTMPGLGCSDECLVGVLSRGISNGVAVSDAKFLNEACWASSGCMSSRRTVLLGGQAGLVEHLCVNSNCRREIFWTHSGSDWESGIDRRSCRLCESGGP